MSLLVADGVHKWFADRLVVRGASLRLSRGDRVGLIGPNGCGKTTLLALLAGAIEPDAGVVRHAADVRVGRVEQDEAVLDVTIDSYVAPARKRIDALEAEMRQLEPLLADDAAALDRYGEIAAAFEHAGGYRFAAEMSRVLGALGFSDTDGPRLVSTLSQGQRARLGLARILLEDPAIMLLDEPTNHLDVSALEWLERFLVERERTFVAVSHDRYFLDRVTTRTLAFEGPDVRAHRGGYSAYARRLASAARPRHARERAREPKPAWRLSGPRPRAAWLIETTPLVVGYDAERPVATAPALRVPVGARIALVGPNGSGKTTLLRTLLGEVPALEGYVRSTSEARAAVLPRSSEASRAAMSGTVLEAFRDATGQTEQEARDLLARFRFRGDEALRDRRALSGGERRRLALATLVARPANLLVLDEPTEHLDVEMRETLERALLAFEGTLLVASQDRYFVDRLANAVWLVADGGVRPFDGNYSAMRRQAETVSAPPPAPATLRAARRQARPRGRSVRPDRVTARNAATLAELEARIAQIERRLGSLAQRVAEIAQAGNYLETRRVGEEYAELERSLRQLYDEWASSASGDSR
jgi:ATP-binding cassette subfamily F protein 3